MKILTEQKSDLFSLNTKEISLETLSNFSSTTSKKILTLLAKKPMYPKEIAKALNIHEQNVYYSIKKLEKAKIIFVSKEKTINGTTAKYYSLTSDSFFFKINNFKKTSRIHEKESKYLFPFISQGSLDALIVVGSPDPHGPLKARSRDGYFGMDLALFLGSFLSYVPDSKVRLDTEIQMEDIKNNNLIILGGPIVNKVTGMVHKSLPIYFDEEKKGIYSTLSNKIYFDEECGFIVKAKNPFNTTKEILVLSGLRNAGTKATILTFLKHFQELKNGNSFNTSIPARVVQGVDLDSDGIVDEIEFLE
jgi:DNA-binding transcriptional ArsR family regulator